MKAISRIGGWPTRKVSWLLVMLFTGWILLDVLLLGTTGGLSRATFDAMVRHRLWAPAVDPRIVIVDIDEASLAGLAPTFGRWPWPRDTLASVLRHLELSGSAATVWDIVFADPDVFHPGGDAAFDSAVRNSGNSHFPVVRLPSGSDGDSGVTRDVLPTLWARSGQGISPVALIPPVFESVARAPLGFNNSYPDSDGVLRRYRFSEALADGGVLKSLAWSVAAQFKSSDPQAAAGRSVAPAPPGDRLLSWPASPDAYPRIPFSVVFSEAERGQPMPDKWRGKIVVIGSTAPGLHDSHPSPLERNHAGVAILATAIDNALHDNHIDEVPRVVLAVLTIMLCVALGLRVQYRPFGSLEPQLFVLPGALLALSYASLHGSPLFLELQLPAGFALTFLVLLRLWGELRRRFWCAHQGNSAGEALCLLPLASSKAWTAPALDRLIDVLERDAPDCRIIALDAHAKWPHDLRWPELARFAAVVGPRDAIHRVEAGMRARLGTEAPVSGRTVAVPSGAGRDEIVRRCLRSWWNLQTNPGRIQENAR